MESFPSIEAFNNSQMQLWRQLNEQLKFAWREYLSGNISMPSAQDKSKSRAKSAGKSTNTRWIQHDIDCTISHDEEIPASAYHSHEQVISPKQQSTQGSTNQIMKIEYILQG